MERTHQLVDDAVLLFSGVHYCGGDSPARGPAREASDDRRQDSVLRVDSEPDDEPDRSRAGGFPGAGGRLGARPSFLTPAGLTFSEVLNVHTWHVTPPTDAERYVDGSLAGTTREAPSSTQRAAVAKRPNDDDGSRARTPSMLASSVVWQVGVLAGLSYV